MPAEQIGDRKHFGLHVAYSHQTIAFDTLPKIFLHIHKKRISRRFVNLVNRFVVAMKLADKLLVSVSRSGVDVRKTIFLVFVKKDILFL